MSIFRKVTKDSSKEAGILLGNKVAENARKATNTTIEGMTLFKSAAEAKKNVDFVQAKGNLFEYIEAAKFNQKAVSNGSNLKAVVTDAVGRPHDATDIEIIRNGKTVRQVQAKFSASKNAAADSVRMQSQDKYEGMQRLIRKDDHYVDTRTGNETSLLQRAKGLAREGASREGNIYQKQYQDVYDNITDELHHDNVSSGGTTLEEVKKAYNSPEQYARSFENKQVYSEMRCTAASMAKASFVTTGVISGISNMMQVYKDEKNLSEALVEVGADAIESGIRGGATGVISTAIRYKGIKAGCSLLSDSTAATVMAGGMVDGGVALLSYAKGEITEEQLRDRLIDTTAKATTTIYFTRAVGAIMGSAMNPVLPMVVYTTASYVITCTREIIRNANLRAEEHDRLTAILQESTRQAREYHNQFQTIVSHCEERQRRMLEGFIDDFDYNISTGENYDQALMAIVAFADRAGISLQHVGFDEFSVAMQDNTVFRLS